MSAKQSKSMKRLVKKQVQREYEWVIDDFIKQVKKLPFRKRLDFAWRMIRAKEDK